MSDDSPENNFAVVTVVYRISVTTNSKNEALLGAAITSQIASGLAPDAVMVEWVDSFEDVSGEDVD